MLNFSSSGGRSKQLWILLGIFLAPLVFGDLLAREPPLALDLVRSRYATLASHGEAIRTLLTFAPVVPPPIERTEPALVIVELEAVEMRGELADGVTYEFWTFNGHVPGPFIRVRVGDPVELHLKNNASNKLTHTIDFHYVTDPGEENVAVFKALNPGLYIYHCAAPPIPLHIANGLYGLVLVEPEEG